MHSHKRPLHRVRKRGSRILRHTRAAKQRQKALALPPPLPLDEEALTAPSPFPGGKPLTEHEHKLAEDLHDWILGGQDGIVSILGTILAIAAITPNRLVVLAAGLAALLAEVISMSTVAYTSVKASKSYYESEREEQRKLIEENPYLQRELLIDAYERRGMSRTDAHRVVTELTKDKKVWLEMLMEEHLHLYAPEDVKPMRSAMIVGTAAFVGSLIPILPFFFATGMPAVYASAGTSVVALFAAGAFSAVLTVGNWKLRGLEMALIGMTAALAGFGIGWLLMQAGQGVL